MHTTSISLLERLRQPTDHRAWERFAELYTPLLYFWARKAGLGEADSADLVQNVFLTLIQRLPSFEYHAGRSFRGWMRTVTLNLWRNQLRYAASRPAKGTLDSHVPANAGDVSQWGDEEHRQYLAARALQLMQSEFEPTTWKACWESVVVGRSAAEIAADLGIKEGTVYAAKSRVLRRLREELDGFWD